MKYVALLRGINVGGKGIIKMADLKKAVEKCGFTNVVTYIQSGNITFESGEIDANKIAARLEDSLSKEFKFDSLIILKTRQQFEKIISDSPPDWEKRNDMRKYLAFVREPVTAGDVLREIELKEGVDFVAAGDGVLYLSTLLSGLTKSRFTKLINKKVYKDITIRNYTTAQKLLALMQEAK
jgi:uncharacterized protein (DUF1697 family)